MSTKNPGLVPHTFKDTGKQVLIRKVSPFLAMEVRKAFPPPTPPMQKVTYPEGVEVMEANTAHPDYLKALQEHEIMVNQKVLELTVIRGVHFEMTDEVRAEIEELRADMRETGIEPKAGDKLFYVLNICIGTTEDMNELVEAIMQRSGPTEAAVQAAVDTFPGGLPRA